MKGRPFGKERTWVLRDKMRRAERDGREKSSPKQKKAKKAGPNTELNFSADRGYTFQEFIAMVDDWERRRKP